MPILSLSAVNFPQQSFTMSDKTTTGKLKKVLVFLAVLLFWTGVWQGVFMLVGKEILVVSPAQVAGKMLELVRESYFWQSIGMTFLRISTGYISGVLLGTLCAVLTVAVPFLKTLLYPLISLVKATPVASFIILALVWIKKDGVPVFITFLIVFPIIWANVSEAVVNTDKGLLEMAKAFSLGRLSIVKNIYLHSVLPYFAAGCTTAIGLAWKAGVAAEVIAMPRSSVGYNLYRSKINIETADLFAWTIVVIVLSVILERFIVFLLGKIKREAK